MIILFYLETEHVGELAAEDKEIKIMWRGIKKMLKTAETEVPKSNKTTHKPWYDKECNNKIQLRTKLR